MSWLTPLGFLGLISIAVLILIYVLKPNYQKKIISSTFVWKLSLKYRKKSIPINYLRDLIIFLCQLFILTSCALILAQPYIKADIASNRAEKIIIIDASAGMNTTFDDKTRFERAVEQVIDKANETFDADGVLSIIIADSSPSFVAQRADINAKSTVIADLENLIEKDNVKCSYSVANIEGAMTLAETVLVENPESEVLLYTGTNYLQTGIVKVIDVTEIGEWNVAILDSQAVVEENYYTFYIDVACYGKNKDVTVVCDIYGANEDAAMRTLSIPVRCEDDEVESIVLKSVNTDSPISEFDYAHVYVREADNLAMDNDFYIYGGRKPQLKIQYASSNPNSFVAAIFNGLRSSLANTWDIYYREVRGEDEKGDKIEPELTGFDLYVFEGETPELLPNDGAIILLNPNKLPGSLGLYTNGIAGGNGLPIELAAPHPVTQYVDAGRLSKAIVTQYTRVSPSIEYDTVLTVNGDPALLVKNTPNEKVAVMTFGFEFSDLSVVVDFPLMMYNLMDYFLPPTLNKYAFQVDETVTLRARGADLAYSGPGIEEKIEQFPARRTLTVPGIYTLSQSPFSNPNVKVVENFFVRIARNESNIFREIDELENPYIVKAPLPSDHDLLIYLIAAAVAILFLEWILQSKDV